MVIGTAAVIDPAIVPAAIAAEGADRIAVGIDARDGRVAIRGWTETSDLTAEAWRGGWRTRGCGRSCIPTSRGTECSTGPDLDGARRVQALGTGVIASGGVAALDDIRAVREAGLAGAIVGRALYEGRFTLAEALEAAGRAAQPMIVRAVVVLALAGALAAFTYLRLERAGGAGWVPLVCRAVAWAALGLLLLNVSCPSPARPGARWCCWMRRSA